MKPSTRPCNARLLTLATAVGLLASTAAGQAEAAPTTLPQSASTSSTLALTPLCFAQPGACEASGPTSAVLRAPVCFADGHAFLRGDEGCSNSQRAYMVIYGEVISPAGEVLALRPLPDACDLGFCVDKKVATPPWEDSGDICCGIVGGTNVCTLPVNDECQIGEPVYCFEYTELDDGTVNCADS